MMNKDQLAESIRKYALQNAIRFKGKANPGAVLPKVLGEDPSLKDKIKEIMPVINKIVAAVNALSVDAQLAALQESAPELLEKKTEERNIFAVLNIKEGQQIKTAFPPGPEKYPHIGHAKACLLNYLLAKKYDGKFVLRFEDTNPTLVKAIFYDVLLDNLSWLGVQWDELHYASDHMKLFYQFAEKIIKEGKAYMCFCNEDAIKKSRAEGTACACRDNSVEENERIWKEFPAYEEGKAILRLKIDLQHQNTTMRDPTIFRIIRTPHARHGTKYTVWPNYDFQNAIMDGYFGITHRVRSKEFELRSELQRYIQDMLGLSRTTTYEFARFNLEGVESSGRIIREKVKSGEFVGWDDPRLTTIVALRRRGFLPEAIKSFVIATGMTKSESTLTWDDFIVHNKRILDKTAKRFFFIHLPEAITVTDAPAQQVTLRMHPTEELGERQFVTGERFFIAKSDALELKQGALYRLMDCLNFRKEDDGFVFDSLEYERFKKQGKRIMHWLPEHGNVDVEIRMHDQSMLKGIAEHTISQLKVGDVIQFERFAFCRLDAIEEKDGKKLYKFWYTHN
ncbi:MAG: glutamate--tRNA ligase [archaeon]